MSQEPVKTHADAQAGGYPPKHYRSQQCLPTEDKERGHRSNMQESHENGGMPVNACPPGFNYQFVLHFEFSNHRFLIGAMGPVIRIQLGTQTVCAPAHLGGVSSVGKMTCYFAVRLLAADFLVVFLLFV